MNVNDSPFQPPIPGMPASFIPRQDLGRDDHKPRTLTIILAIAGAVLLASPGGVGLYIAVHDRSVLTVQNRHLQSQVSGLRSKERNDYTTNSGEITDLGQMLLPYATAHCSTDLTGPNGPAQYWFNCTAHNPQTTTQPSG